MPTPAFSRIRWRTAATIFLVLLALLFSMVFSIASHLLAFAASPASTAPDGPGALSHFDLARKDGLGTARSLKSITATPLSCSASSKAQQRCKEVYDLQSLVHDCKWSSQRCLLSHSAAVVPEPGKCTEALKCASGSYIVTLS